MAAVAEFLQRHQRVGLDTPVFIYHYQQAAAYLPATRPVFRSIVTGATSGVTSVLTMTELTVQPIARGQQQLVNQYTAILLRLPNLTLVDITAPTAQRAARIRARHRLRTVDALQLAAALDAGATGFVTNDRALRSVDALEVLVLADTDDVQAQAQPC